MFPTHSKYLSPKTDLVFKRIFGEHPHLLISFLNGILPLPEGGMITEITYLSPEQVPDLIILKNTIVDVKCTDQRGRTFIVKMQMQWNKHFTSRMILNTSKAYSRQIEAGDPYGLLCPVYGIALVDTIFEPETTEWFHQYQILNTKDSNKQLEGLELFFIELPKFIPSTWKERKLGVLWLRFLSEVSDKNDTVPAELLEDDTLKEALELARRAAYTLGELEWYDKYWDSISREKTLLIGSFDKGKEEGIVIGI